MHPASRMGMGAQRNIIISLLRACQSLLRVSSICAWGILNITRNTDSAQRRLQWRTWLDFGTECYWISFDTNPLNRQRFSLLGGRYRLVAIAYQDLPRLIFRPENSALVLLCLSYWIHRTTRTYSTVSLYLARENIIRRVAIFHSPQSLSLLSA